MYGHVDTVPDHYIGQDAARELCIAAVVLSAIAVVLVLLALAAYYGLRAGHRNWQAMQATEQARKVAWMSTWANDTVELPLIPADPIAQHADRIAAWAGPTYRYPVITDAEWATAEHRFHADYDAWRRTS